MTCKERRNETRSQEEEQSKETAPQDNQAIGLAEKRSEEKLKLFSRT